MQIFFFQVHEQSITSTKSVERGSFVIDEHIGSNTQFQLYTLGSKQNNGLVKGISINDKKAGKYSQMDDVNLQEYQYLTVYQVPFDTENNIGMLWSYEINKALDSIKDTAPKYVTQVVSRYAQFLAYC